MNPDTLISVISYTVAALDTVCSLFFLATYLSLRKEPIKGVYIHIALFTFFAVQALLVGLGFLDGKTEYILVSGVIALPFLMYSWAAYSRYTETPVIGRKKGDKALNLVDQLWDRVSNLELFVRSLSIPAAMLDENMQLVAATKSFEGLLGKQLNYRDSLISIEPGGDVETVARIVIKEGEAAEVYHDNYTWTLYPVPPGEEVEGVVLILSPQHIAQ